ncbi:MAG: lysyl oxidase family protein [Nannocystaceae bacterium]
MHEHERERGRGRRRPSPWALALALALACTSGDDGATSATATTSASSSATAETHASATVGESTTAGDALPPAPILMSPADGTVDASIHLELCWQPVIDPEGEPVRYRVFVNDTELTKGILDPVVGWEGPCVGPLDLKFETSYTWAVQAFEADDPSRNGPKSATWSFTTRGDGLSGTIFDDDFDDDLGWTVSGDAAQGAWIRGGPVPTYDGEALSQPGRCASGPQCMFTGQNLAGIADMADVSGGATILTSPPFDLEGAAAATLQLRRFFYKSAAGPSSSLTIELLVPDLDDPGQMIAYPLEALDQPSAGAPENVWTPREYAACDAPMRAGSRLRITAADTGAGILEAAIDRVSVHAHADATVCGGAEGAHCEPALGPAACPGELLCCAQGVVHEGVNRCVAAVPGLDFESPPPTPDDPGNGPLGCPAPDLILDPLWIDPLFTEIDVDGQTCELFEGCLGGVGKRRLMLFTAATPNIGSDDLVMGIPANHPELFHYSACHDHYHFDEFARYELRDAQGQMVVANGHKQAFCMLDTVSWAWPLAIPRFDCANQGISRGFSDFYDAGLPCQWIDVTGVPPGDYTLRIALNQTRPDAALPILIERDYDNNTLEVPVSIP